MYKLLKKTMLEKNFIRTQRSKPNYTYTAVYVTMVSKDRALCNVYDSYSANKRHIHFSKTFLHIGLCLLLEILQARLNKLYNYILGDIFTC